jgi:hypothetical protein
MMAIHALLLTGTVVRIELRKAGKSLEQCEEYWLGHLDSIAELLMPSEKNLLRAIAIVDHYDTWIGDQVRKELGIEGGEM